MLGLTKAWYGDYSGNVVPFNAGGGGIDLAKIEILYIRKYPNEYATLSDYLFIMLTTTNYIVLISPQNNTVLFNTSITASSDPGSYLYNKYGLLYDSQFKYYYGNYLNTYTLQGYDYYYILDYSSFDTDDYLNFKLSNMTGYFHLIPGENKIAYGISSSTDSLSLNVIPI